MITTDKGEIPIRDIKIGDMVLTSQGYKKVLEKFNNGMKRVFRYSLELDTETLYLTSTDDHKIKTKNKWIEIGKLKKGMKLYRHKPLTEKHITDIEEKDTLQKGQKNYTTLYGNTIMEKNQKDSIYTTKTKTPKIMILKILNLLKRKNTSKNTEKEDMRKIKNGLMSFIKKVLKALKNGIKAKRGENGIFNTEKIVGLGENMKRKSVRSVEKNIKQDTKELVNIATKIVKLKRFGVEESWVEETYDLMVDECHEYYANGILVHNCIDAIRYALEMEDKQTGKYYIY